MSEKITKDQQHPPHWVLDRMWHEYEEPSPSHTSLPAIAAQIVREVEEIDACIRAGAPDFVGDFSQYSKYLRNHHLKQKLNKAVENPVLLNCPKRDEWIDACIARFRHYLAPQPVTFEALQDAEKSVVVMPGTKVVMNSDLMVRQRFWGIVFFSRKEKHDVAIANLYLRAALARFASDIASVNRFCLEWTSNSAFLDTVSFSHDRRGNLFEQIILGILNQLEPTVIQASMYDDVREWSDFRISRKGALNNVSIQVKFVHRLSDQDIAKSNPKAWKTVILSPLSIAAFLEESFDPDLYRCSWSELLELFPVRPCSTGDLSRQIYDLFEHLFYSPRTHPLSPIIDVPYPIRLAIHLFVASQAAEIQARALWRKIALLAAALGNTDNQVKSENT